MHFVVPLHHVMLMALSMAQLHLLVQDHQSEIKMTMSCDAIVGTSGSITWCQQHLYWHHCLPYIMTMKKRCYMTLGHLVPLVLATISHTFSSINNGTISFLKIIQWTWGGIYIGITWCYWYWCHDVTTLVSASCDVDSIISGTTAFHRLGGWKWSGIWILQSCDTIGTTLPSFW